MVFQYRKNKHTYTFSVWAQEEQVVYARFRNAMQTSSSSKSLNLSDLKSAQFEGCTMLSQPFRSNAVRFPMENIAQLAF